MARKRMIDPNIWMSEDVGKLSVLERLLLIGMFSNADDEGKGRANPPLLRSIIFPYDDIPVSEIQKGLENIEKYIHIEVYEYDGSTYYKFTQWKKWQRVEKPQPSIIPEPVTESFHDQSPNHSTIVPRPIGDEEKRREDSIGEEKGREENRGEDKESFADVADYFTEKAGLMMASPKDIQIAEDLVSKMPIDYIKQGIDLAFQRYKPKHEKDKIRSLSYCEPVILDNWQLIKAKEGSFEDKFNKNNKNVQAGLDYVKKLQEEEEREGAT